MYVGGARILETEPFLNDFDFGKRFQKVGSIAPRKSVQNHSLLKISNGICILTLLNVEKSTKCTKFLKKLLINMNISRRGWPYSKNHTFCHKTHLIPILRAMSS